jgi:hypothetical protein
VGFNLIEVSDNVNKIPVKEKKTLGHVTHRVDFKYSKKQYQHSKKMKAL